MKWTLQQIAEWSQGQIISTHQTEFSEFSTDTRKPCDKKVFIALKGDQFDAHDFLDQAAAQGAGLLLVHRMDPRFDTLKNKISIIKVDDTLSALQSWAKHYCKTLRAQVFAITGSNGKTTTKEFLAKILSTTKKTYFTEGSFNNHWGLPFSILSANSDHQCLVLEMGMNHAGEITNLVHIADPDFVVCTMVGSAHIEFFGSLKAIAKAKEEIYQETRESTVRVFNQDQDLTFDMMYPVAKKYPASRMLSYSVKNDETDVYMKVEKSTGQGLQIVGSIAALKGSAIVPVFGDHNVVNLMAAACLAYASGMKPEQIWAALPLCKSTWGRNEFIKTKEDVEIIFDGYNANVDSMKVLFSNVQALQVSGVKIAALGQMKEQGAAAPELHREVAATAAKSGFEFIYFYGENFKDFEAGLKSAGYSNYIVEPEFTEKIKSHLKSTVTKGDLLAIKGSRGAATENYIKLFSAIDWKPKT